MAIRPESYTGPKRNARDDNRHRQRGQRIRYRDLIVPMDASSIDHRMKHPIMHRETARDRTPDPGIR